MFDPLTLDQMRVLVAVAETGSFSAAARKLGRVQSAISQAVQAMESALQLTLFDRARKTPALTDVGRAILEDARTVLAKTHAMQARARGLRDDLEPELTLAVDATFPMPLLMKSLEALRGAFPTLPATLFTDALGGARETLLAGAARMAIYPIFGGPPAEVSAEFLARIALAPVAAADHPLARLGRPASREDLEAQVQLVLTGRTAYAQSLRGGVVSPHVWRFVDQTTRLDFLLSGFGWCNMPLHMVQEHIDAGRLRRLEFLHGEPAPEFPLYVVCPRDRPLGRAGRWLAADLRERLKSCPSSFPPALAAE
ncbi:MAG: LysR family transcriptional regulator [Pseudomonadota bacterium]|nr:LysR family transcriptional regulator [Pseudomonadota bacterium]